MLNVEYREATFQPKIIPHEDEKVRALSEERLKQNREIKKKNLLVNGFMNVH